MTPTDGKDQSGTEAFIGSPYVALSRCSGSRSEIKALPGPCDMSDPDKGRAAQSFRNRCDRKVAWYYYVVLRCPLRGPLKASQCLGTSNAELVLF